MIGVKKCSASDYIILVAFIISAFIEVFIAIIITRRDNSYKRKIGYRFEKGDI